MGEGEEENQILKAVLTLLPPFFSFCIVMQIVAD